PIGMKQRLLLQKILIGLVVFFFLVSWIGRAKEAYRRHQGALAIVHVTGVIRSDLSSGRWSASQDAEDIARRLYKLSEDDEVKAIVLRINSPGGSVGAVQEIHAEV